MYELINYFLIGTHEHTNVLQPVKTYLHQLNADTACFLTDLQCEMTNREKVSNKSMLSVRFDNEDDVFVVFATQ